MEWRNTLAKGFYHEDSFAESTQSRKSGICCKYHAAWPPSRLTSLGRGTLLATVERKQRAMPDPTTHTRRPTSATTTRGSHAKDACTACPRPDDTSPLHGMSNINRARGQKRETRHLQDSNLRVRTQCLKLSREIAGHRLNHSAKVSCCY